MISGVLDSGIVMLMPRQGLFTKTLFTIRGDDWLINATTPEMNWLSQLLLRKTFRSIVAEALLPPIAAPYPPAPCMLPSKILPEISDPVAPNMWIPAPNEADPPLIVNPMSALPGPIWMTGSPRPAVAVDDRCCGPVPAAQRHVLAVEIQWAGIVAGIDDDHIPGRRSVDAPLDTCGRQADEGDAGNTVVGGNGVQRASRHGRSVANEALAGRRDYDGDHRDAEAVYRSEVAANEHGPCAGALARGRGDKVDTGR